MDSPDCTLSANRTNYLTGQDILPLFSLRIIGNA
jgi:hypothetical protein